MRTAVLNIGTKRDNKVSDNSTTISFDDIDYKVDKLFEVMGKSEVISCNILPVDSEWGREWTIVIKIEVPESNKHDGEDYAEMACIIFEQEAVSFKEWNEEDGTGWRTLCDRGLVYHRCWFAPKHGKKLTWNNEYFIDA